MRRELSDGGDENYKEKEKKSQEVRRKTMAEKCKKNRIENPLAGYTIHYK